MKQREMIDLVNRYFAAVDGENIAVILSTLTSDCTFSVETHGTSLKGHDAIRRMFYRLWSDHASVKHLNFSYLAAPDDHRIAVQFQVENRLHDGEWVHKSNCNFFDIRNQKFAKVAVYMAGRNILEA